MVRPFDSEVNKTPISRGPSLHLTSMDGIFIVGLVLTQLPERYKHAARSDYGDARLFVLWYVPDNFTLQFPVYTRQAGDIRGGRSFSLCFASHRTLVKVTCSTFSAELYIIRRQWSSPVWPEFVQIGRCWKDRRICTWFFFHRTLTENRTECGSSNTDSYHAQLIGSNFINILTSIELDSSELRRITWPSAACINYIK